MHAHDLNKLINKVIAAKSGDSIYIGECMSSEELVDFYLYLLRRLIFPVVNSYKEGENLYYILTVKKK